MRDLFAFELERLKGLPMGYTQTEVLNADRNQRIRTSWDMIVASRFLHRLSRNLSATTEQCSNTTAGQKRKSVELHRDKGHHDVCNIKRPCTAATQNGLARDLGKLAEQRKAPNSHVKCKILPSADMIKRMNDINMAMGFDRSDTGRIEKYATKDETSEALHNRIAATISTSLNYGELFGLNKKLHRDNLDEIINNISAIMAKFYMAMFKFYLAGIDTADKTTADF